MDRVAMSLPIEELGRLVVAKRGSRGVRAAAADVGISSATLSRVENGHMPDLETFAKICKWLNRDPREFLGFDREEAAPRQAVVQFKKDRTVSRQTAIALGELILAAQNAIRARAQLIDR
jgi:transcriptional regulator with XRE-family HTH domain